MWHGPCDSPAYSFFFFFFNDTATTEIYTLSLHDALPIYRIWAVKESSGYIGATASSIPLQLTLHAPDGIACLAHRTITAPSVPHMPPATALRNSPLSSMTATAIMQSHPLFSAPTINRDLRIAWKLLETTAKHSTMRLSPTSPFCLHSARLPSASVSLLPVPSRLWNVIALVTSPRLSASWFLIAMRLNRPINSARF